MGEMLVVNEHDVPEVKTGRGYTKFLVNHKKGEGPSIMVRMWGPETDIPVHLLRYVEGGSAG